VVGPHRSYPVREHGNAETHQTPVWRVARKSDFHDSRAGHGSAIFRKHGVQGDGPAGLRHNVCVAIQNVDPA